MTLIVLFVCASLSGFVDFISQTDDIGIGKYGIYEAVQYTLLKLPSSVFQLIPIIVLIGSLISLGNLSKNNEITVKGKLGELYESFHPKLFIKKNFFTE